MSRVRNKDTRLEQKVRSALHRRGLRFRKHLHEVPGRPDVAFTRARVLVFIDGDFWHGYGFRRWKENLAPSWQRKISENRARDRRNSRRLRQDGWKVVRLWQHEVERDLNLCVERVVEAVAKARAAEDGRLFSSYLS